MKRKNTLLILFLLCVLLTLTIQTGNIFASDSPTLSWRNKTSMPTACGQIAIETGNDGLIYVAGGHTGSGPGLTTVEAYEPITDRWTTKAPLIHSTRGAAIAKGSEGLLYVIGGYNTSYVSSVQVYNTSTNSWTLAASIPNPS
jgi:N-acetylneuraminic acid mutarotase